MLENFHYLSKMETKTHKGLPLYKLSINVEDDAFVNAIGIVSAPAIGVLGQFFNEVKKDNILLAVKETTTKQLFADDLKSELLGACMIPDLPMLRNANEIIPHEHYVAFTKEEIRTIAKVFHLKGCQNSINLDHSTTTANSSSFISYFIDSSKNIGTPKGMEKLPEGTWMIGMSVSNKDVFEALTKTNFGFSVEGLFAYSSFQLIGENTFEKQLNEYDLFLKSIAK